MDRIIPDNTEDAGAEENVTLRLGWICAKQKESELFCCKKLTASIETIIIELYNADRCSTVALKTALTVPKSLHNLFHLILYIISVHVY